jgi:hypothetical protein
VRLLINTAATYSPGKIPVPSAMKSLTSLSLSPKNKKPHKETCEAFNKYGSDLLSRKNTSISTAVETMKGLTSLFILP